MKFPNPYTPKNTARRNFYKCSGGDLHRMRLYLNDMRDSMSAKRNFIANSHKEELKLWPNMGQMIDEVYEGKYHDYENSQNLSGLAAYFTLEALEVKKARHS